MPNIVGASVVENPKKQFDVAKLKLVTIQQELEKKLSSIFKDKMKQHHILKLNGHSLGDSTELQSSPLNT